VLRADYAGDFGVVASKLLGLLKRRLELSEAAVRYLLAKLSTDINFYQELAGTEWCSAASRAKWELLTELRDALQGALVETQVLAPAATASDAEPRAGGPELAPDIEHGERPPA
jgi:hypothetical protein